LVIMILDLKNCSSQVFHNESILRVEEQNPICRSIIINDKLVCDSNIDILVFNMQKNYKIDGTISLPSNPRPKPVFNFSSLEVNTQIDYWCTDGSFLYIYGVYMKQFCIMKWRINNVQGKIDSSSLIDKQYNITQTFPEINIRGICICENNFLFYDSISGWWTALSKVSLDNPKHLIPVEPSCFMRCFAVDKNLMYIVYQKMATDGILVEGSEILKIYEIVGDNKKDVGEIKVPGCRAITAYSMKFAFADTKDFVYIWNVSKKIMASGYSITKSSVTTCQGASNGIKMNKNYIATAGMTYIYIAEL